MKYLRTMVLGAAFLGLLGFAGATTGNAATVAPAVVTTQRHTIDVSKPLPQTLSVSVGDEIIVVTDNSAPGAPAILGVACVGFAPSPAIQELKANNHFFHLLRAAQAGSCPLMITYSHYPSDPKFTKRHTVMINVK